MYETDPNKSPSNIAYNGTVIGAHVFLKIVIKAKTNPPKPPIIINENPFGT